MFEVRSRRARVALQIVATLLVIPFLIPLIAMVQGSFKGRGWDNYATVLALPEVPLFFLNSAIISACTIALVYVCTVLASFGFSKLRVRGKEFFFWAILVCLTLPEVVLVAPLFSTAVALGLFDTYWSVILPLAALQMPFTILLARNFVDGIPNELFDAAKVDGASTWSAFWHIILPLTRPISAAIVVLTFVNAWNAYLLPLIFLQGPEKQTVTLLPQYFISQFTNDQTRVLASAVIIAFPVIIAYLLLQRLFERGLAAGALK
jgi:ABC-type glycerol-3-phosphate transport system permease component